MENILSDMFSPDLIMLDVAADSWKEVLRTAGDYLYGNGYVKESFTEALIQREFRYPTGLPTSGIKVALPHTDPIHVNKPGILLMNLKNPVAFKEMGSGKHDVMVDMVFVIAVTNAANEVVVLRKIMGLFTEDDVLKYLKECNDRERTYEFLTRQVNPAYNFD